MRFLKGRVPAMSSAIWSEAPKLAIPESPAILSDSRHLWLAYETTMEPRREMYAVVKFDDVIDYRLSPINDEGLGEHPCISAGIKVYEFNEILNSPLTLKWAVLKGRHFVVSFKDETLDVVSKTAKVVANSLRSRNALTALMDFMSELRNQV